MRRVVDGGIALVVVMIAPFVKTAAAAKGFSLELAALRFVQFVKFANLTPTCTISYIYEVRTALTYGTCSLGLTFKVCFSVVVYLASPTKTGCGASG